MYVADDRSVRQQALKLEDVRCVVFAFSGASSSHMRRQLCKCEMKSIFMYTCDRSKDYNRFIYLIEY